MPGEPFYIGEKGHSAVRTWSHSSIDKEGPRVYRGTT
jgi:hypothetical protein